MRQVATSAGLALPVLGIGTWKMGEDPARRAEELGALGRALDLGITLVDTAEMYADGGAERLVGEAIRGRREGLTIVTKVYPWNASREGTRRAAEASLRRLGTEVIDLYLLHWPGRHPLEETLAAFVELREEGKIRHYGLSNVDAGALARAAALPGGAGIAADQVLYSLAERGAEWSLLATARERGVAIMAYTPLASGSLARHAALRPIAARHGASPAQVALAWSISRDGVVTIPKAADAAHVEENAGALRVELTEQDHAELDRAFPPPARETPLAII